MALPKQVQRDNEEIAAYEESLRKELKPAEQPAEQTDEVAPPAPPVEVPVAAEPVPRIEPAVKPVDWEQKYKTLQGIHQVDSRNHQALKKQFAELEAEVKALKAAPVSPPSLVSDEEKVEFGEDLLDVQRRIAKEELAPILAQVAALTAENDKLREQLENVDASVASSSFEQKLLNAVPDFWSVNDDPRWVAWLDEVDPILRGPRRTVAQAAYERGDVEATASYVNMFKATLAPKSVAPSKDESSRELQSQVAPSRSSANASAPNEQGKRFYTESEASKLFDRVGQLYRQGKVAEASELDTEITLAYHEGRVR